jgi:hydrogenase nickel incorporation protein HypA/HybF
MHELSIALSIVEQLAEETEKHGGGTVEVVHLKIGVLAGVDGDALGFAFELACEGTPFAGSRLEIERIPLLVYCPVCATTHTPEVQAILCPRCITPAQEILQGRELEVTALEIVA